MQQNDEDLESGFRGILFMGFLSRSKAKAIYGWDVITYFKI